MSQSRRPEPEVSTEAEQTLMFLHIPKTAGATLAWIIERQYEPATMFRTHRVLRASLKAKGIHARTVHASERWEIAREELANLEMSEKRRIKAVAGHMNFGWHKLLPQPCTYVTVLRNPIDQVLSHYSYILAHKREGHCVRDAILAQRMSLVDYVRSGISLMVNNAHTRLISGVGHDVGFGQCTIEMLQAAKDNLKQHFSVVGLTEEFDATLILLRRAFGWHMPFYGRQNVTRNRLRRETVSLEDLSVIEKYNELDIELYSYGRTLYEESLAQQDNSFAAELRTFKLLNSLYGLGYSGTRKTRRLGRRIVAYCKRRPS